MRGFALPGEPAVVVLSRASQLDEGGLSICAAFSTVGSWLRLHIERHSAAANCETPALRWDKIAHDVGHWSQPGYGLSVSAVPIDQAIIAAETGAEPVTFLPMRPSRKGTRSSVKEMR